LHIFTFQGPSGTQIEQGFFWSHYFPRATKWDEEAHEWATRAQMRPGGVGPWPGRTTPSH
jgi:hypothetical protein